MKRIFAIVFMIAMLFSISAVAEKDTYLLNAWKSVGSPYQITAIYRYHYQGIENLDNGKDCSLAVLFDNQNLPDNGYFFIIRTVSNSYYALENENGSVISTMDLNKTNENQKKMRASVNEIFEQSRNPYLSEYKIKELREDAKLYSSLSMTYAKQAVAATGYNLVTSPYVYMPMDKEINCWYMYDEKQIIESLE